MASADSGGAKSWTMLSRRSVKIIQHGDTEATEFLFVRTFLRDTRASVVYKLRFSSCAAISPNSQYFFSRVSGTLTARPVNMCFNCSAFTAALPSK